MADGKRAKLVGLIKNLEIKIKNSVVPIDFFVLDEDTLGAKEIILGPPFLKLVKAVLDTRNGILKIELGGEDVLFKFDEVIPIEEIIEEKEEDQFSMRDFIDPLQKVLEEC